MVDGTPVRDASGPISPTPPFPLGKKEREIEEAIDGAGGGATAAAADAHTSLAEALIRRVNSVVTYSYSIGFIL